MHDNNNDEIEIVTSLYNDGKITKEQKDALLSALESDDGKKDVRADNKLDDRRINSKPKKKVVFIVSGVNGATDATLLSNAVADTDGVRSANTDIKKSRLTVKGRFETDDVIAAAKAAGFLLKPIGVDYDDSNDSGENCDQNSSFIDKLNDELDELGKELSALGEELSNSVDDEDDEEVDDEDDEEEDEDYEEDEEEEDEDDDEDDEDDESDDTFSQINSLTELLDSLGDKISSAAKRSILGAKKVGKKIKKVVNNAVSTIKYDGGEVQKINKIDYDKPYDTMVIDLHVYNSDGRRHFTSSASDTIQFLQDCSDALDEEAFKKVAHLLDTEFTGSYKFIYGDTVLKLRIHPEDDDD